MSTDVTLFEQDYIRYHAGQEYVTGEILELDIPHPTSEKDTQTYIRVQTPVGIKLTTRAEIAEVLCPSCHPSGKPLDLDEEYAVIYHELEMKAGPVTNSQGLTEIRRFRYCDYCKYFKEAR